jgi:hypothetical protein
VLINDRTALTTYLPADNEKINILRGAFCKTKIFVQNQGMREILPQAYD